jgi:hypothetical protein
MNIISYSLFGYGKERHNSSLPFEAYLDGMITNFKVNTIVYPDWITRVHTDEATYNAYSVIFNTLAYTFKFQYIICEPDVICKAMLWRMKPCFDESVEYVICRDLDSISSYRDAQCVKYWINNNKSAHAITDNREHNITMLGGMVGFKAKNFKK